MGKKHLSNAILRDLTYFTKSSDIHSKTQYLLSALDLLQAALEQYTTDSGNWINHLEKDRRMIKSIISSPEYYKSLRYAGKSLQCAGDLGQKLSQLCEVRQRIVSVLTQSGLDE